ncbi:lipase maturation factor 2-like [Xenia sp. Carnegie-2017]|uniref:lipase maturation factor 2-like n=1 Tax=Xenia sp. Carnegie-2017 TaxID=2897299 RepID=UPI001F04DD09|nr:lipase maturation factor 2-like [Xenia sp. Carnegie-2017]
MWPCGLGKEMFLLSMGSIYLFAFASLYMQIPGLFGDNGLLPVRNILRRDNKASLMEDIRRRPTLLWFIDDLGLTAQTGMSLLCIIGVYLSVMCIVSKGWRSIFSFSFMWILYFSLYQVGQTFLWFQWDILLLEAGFLCIIVSLSKNSRNSAGSPNDLISLWLVKWLLFRLMFASGVVKLTSGCPTWWELTALNWHYESQCIPTPLAWFAHHLPSWFQRFSVMMTFVIEIPIPFLFFSPIRSLRMFAFYLQVTFQLLIIATGNYNFFNLLTIALCLSLLHDNGLPFTGILSCELKRRCRVFNVIVNTIRKLIVLVVAFVFVYWIQHLFLVEFDSKNIIITKIGQESLFQFILIQTLGVFFLGFTYSQFVVALKTIVPFSIWVGALSLGFVIFQSLLRCCQQEQVLDKIFSLVLCCVKAGVAIWLFSISLVPYSALDEDTQHNVWPVVRKWHSQIDQFHIVNSYGLFRRMTGVGGRPEIGIEGSDSLDGPWQEYNFKYKPGDVNNLPPFLLPHQPRLDWQMWFAALGSYHHNPWFVHLAYRLLSGERAVLDLMAKNQTLKKPPRYVRAILYKYHYTKVSCNSLIEFVRKARKVKSFWWREYSGEYLPPLSKSEPSMLQFLNHYGLGPSKDGVTISRTGYLHHTLLFIRSYLRASDAWILLGSLFFLAFAFSDSYICHFKGGRYIFYKVHLP